MTLLGKIFTVMILLMTILFMGFSIVVYATHRNWKTIVTNQVATAENRLGLDQQLANAEDNAEGLEDEIQRLKHKLAVEQVARVHVLAALESRLGNARAKYLTAERNFNDTRVELSRVAIIGETTSDFNKTLLSTVAGLRTNINNVLDDRNIQFDSVVSLTATVNQLEGQERRLAERRDQLVDQLAVRERLIRQNGISLEEDDSLPSIHVS